jgi:phage gpG-like protein
VGLQMGLEFSITENMTAAVHDIIERGENLPMDEIAQFLVESVHQNFDAEGRPDPWAPRAESPYDDGHPILRDSGSLYESIYASTISQDEITVTSNLEYAEYNDQGTSRMPARPFFLMQDSDADEIENIIAQHFNFEG